MKSQAAIVFGGASGLGEASARKLAEAGHRVTIADLNDEARSEEHTSELQSQR